MHKIASQHLIKLQIRRQLWQCLANLGLFVVLLEETGILSKSQFGLTDIFAITPLVYSIL
jgi:hypothetical protein